MSLKNIILEYIGALEGYHQTCKMLHWGANNHSEHILLDRIDGDILKFEDRLAEASMGKLRTKFGIGSLKAMLPNAETLEGLISEFEDDTIKLKKDIGDKIEYSGIQNILDEILENINTYDYLRTLK